jgi:transcriptional regulator GlxA family with amidase domain
VKRPGARIVPVTVVLPPRLLLLDVAGPIEVLRKANIEQSAMEFQVRYVGPAHAIRSSVGLTLSGIEPLPARLSTDGLLVLPGSANFTLGDDCSPCAKEQAAERAIVEWLGRSVREPLRLVCVCSGALIAARAGLLDGVRCTTHHGSINELRRIAPRAHVEEDRLYVEDGSCLTSAGITAGVDLMLHIVNGLLGPSVALCVARYMLVYMRRGGADPQLSPWLEGRNHLHPAIHQLQDSIAAHPARKWSVSEMARIAHASPRTLSRLFNAHTGMSVTDYVNRVRVALARELVQQTNLDMERIASRTGFGSTRLLRRAWERFDTQKPRELRKASRLARAISIT